MSEFKFFFVVSVNIGLKSGLSGHSYVYLIQQLKRAVQISQRPQNRSDGDGADLLWRLGLFVIQKDKTLGGI